MNTPEPVVPEKDWISVWNDTAEEPGAYQGDQKNEVIELTWAVIDGRANEKLIGRLRQLVRSKNEAREAYQSTVALEQGLLTYFGHSPGIAASKLPS